MSVQKIVLKGTSKISLHERFTNLRNLDKAIKSAGYTVKSSPVKQHDAREPRARPNRSMSEGLSLYHPTRATMGPSAAVAAAQRIKKKSIRQRLGVRARVDWNLDRGWRSEAEEEEEEEEDGWPRHWGYNQRWGSTRSLNSQGSSGGTLRRWNSYRSLPGRPFRRRGNWGRGGGRLPRWNNRFNRGYRRFRFNGQGGGRWGRGRGRGRGGGRGRGRANREPMPTKEELDKQLDQYMAGARAALKDPDVSMQSVDIAAV